MYKTVDNCSDLNMPINIKKKYLKSYQCDGRHSSHFYVAISQYWKTFV